MENHFNILINIIIKSIAKINEEYFNFPVAGEQNPIQRERVFCGELYHQIRLNLEELPYSVNNEPDKNRHPIIEEQCGAINPDLIIHKLGEMTSESNLALIEVKRSKGNLTDGILKDMKTINCMTTIQYGYFGGIIIVFGELSEVKKRNLINRINEVKHEKTKKLILILIASNAAQPETIEI
jgi:hypothetical protein